MMNNNLKNLNIEPDEAVWQKVSATIHRKVIMRRVMWSVAAVAVLGAMVVAFLPQSQPQTDSIAMIPNQSTAVVEEQIAQPETAPISEELPTTKKTQAMQLEIETEVITVEEAPDTPTEIAIPEYKADDANLTIIGGADGPTAILTTEAEPKAMPTPTVKAMPQPKIQTPQPQIQTPKPIAQTSESVVQTSESVASTETVEEESTEIIQEANPSKFGNNPIPEEAILSIPNIIIPNGDVEENRYFRIHANDQVNYFRVRIFDRAGRLVFQSEDINNSWDGTRNGYQLPQAAYVYVIQYRDRRGEIFTEKGTVTLVR